MLLLLQQNLGFAWGATDAPPVVETGPTPAGRKKRRKYVIEVDEQEFIVDSIEQAQALLDRARELAKQTAEKAAEQALKDATPRAVSLGKVKRIKIKPPEITGSRGIGIPETREQIKSIYADAAVVAELRLLLLMQELDEEEAILALLQ